MITASEALTCQHAEKLRGLSAREVFAYPMDGDASAMGRLPPNAVIVLDINKLATEKKGDGITVPTSAFADGRNRRGSPRISPNCLPWRRPAPSFCHPMCESVRPASG